ncbi:MAG TPA: hypothetical protein VK804_02825, partial [Bradyrhizobium sp.]|uniref:hypothetical protein n=1 Tax=Bradyrhizobium sp. TaxID=376 RepID=UPI002C2F7BAF
DRIAAEDFDTLAFHDFRDRGAELHADPSQEMADVGLGLCGASWNRNRMVGKAGAGYFPEALPYGFASQSAIRGRVTPIRPREGLAPARRPPGKTDQGGWPA